MKGFTGRRIFPVCLVLGFAAAIGVGYLVGYQDGSRGDGPGLLKDVNAAQAQAAEGPL